MPQGVTDGLGPVPCAGVMVETAVLAYTQRYRTVVEENGRAAGRWPAYPVIMYPRGDGRLYMQDRPTLDPEPEVVCDGLGWPRSAPFATYKGRRDFSR